MSCKLSLYTYRFRLVLALWIPKIAILPWVQSGDHMVGQKNEINSF